MQSGPLYEKKDYTPCFSGHQTFPLRYGWLKKVYDKFAESKNTNKIFSDNQAIIYFGVGKNMVTSMKHWAIACKFIEKDTKSYKNSKLAGFLLADDGADPWIEHIASTWLIHWLFASNPDNTTCYYLFNNYSLPYIDKEILQKHLIELSTYNDWRPVSPHTIRKDIDCLTLLYSPDTKQRKNNRNILSALTELPIMEQRNNQYYFRYGEKRTLPTEVFLFALLDFWDKYAPESSSLNFDTILYACGSPGKIFLLDEKSLWQYLNTCTKIISDLHLNESAGLQQITRTKDIPLKLRYLKLTNMYSGKGV